MFRSLSLGRRALGSVLATTIVVAPALPGCGPNEVAPADQAKVSQEAAKSSMDYMRQRINDRKGKPSTETRPTRGPR